MSTDRRDPPPPRRSETENSLVERAVARLASGGSIQPVAVPRPVAVTVAPPGDRLAAPRRIAPLRIPAAPNAAVVEQFRMIGQQLRRQAADHDGQQGLSVMVTSPRAGDGKSFVALHLALVLAGQGDSEVVLVDAHLDRPALAGRLGVTAELGLRDYLSDPSLDLSRVLVATEVPRLTLLPGGPAIRGDLALGGRLRGLLTALHPSDRDRIVVLDTPPALAGSSMPYLLAPLVDEVVVVVAAEETEVASVSETLERLQDHAGKLSLVFNKAGRGTGRMGEGACSLSITA